MLTCRGDLGKIRQQDDIGLVQVGKVRTVALQLQIHGLVFAGEDHQSPVIENAFAIEHNGDIIEGILRFGADHGNHIKPQAKSNSKGQQQRADLTFHACHPPFP